MAMTSTLLMRGAAAAAVAAGLIFIGVQINHPPLNDLTITSTEVIVRNTLKLTMAVLAVVGLTGIYLRTVAKTGVLGLVGFLCSTVGYLIIICTSAIAAYVLPTIATANPAYVNDVLAAATGGTPDGDIGALSTVIRIQGLGYLIGGVTLGVALYRARVLPRWAASLLALSGIVTLGLSELPEAFHRLLAFPNGIAMIGLGMALWRTTLSAVGPALTPAPTSTSIR